MDPRHLALTAILAVALVACTPDSGPDTAAVGEPEPKTAEPDANKEETEDELAEQVARMGAIGFSYGGVFSPQG